MRAKTELSGVKTRVFNEINKNINRCKTKAPKIKTK